MLSMLSKPFNRFIQFKSCSPNSNQNLKYLL